MIAYVGGRSCSLDAKQMPSLQFCCYRGGGPDGAITNENTSTKTVYDRQ